MKGIIVIILLLFSMNCFALADTKVLIVPMQKEAISFDKHVVKMADYNKVKVDSIKMYVQNICVELLKSEFPSFSFVDVSGISDYHYLVDSLDFLYQWNCFQIKKIKDSKGLDKIIQANDEGPQLKYFGRIINEKNSTAFKELIKQYNFNFIFLLNKFETITRRPFSKETSICLHFEIYNNSLNKVFGAKSYFSVKISKTMYYSVFTYYIYQALKEFYERINKFIQ